MSAPISLEDFHGVRLLALAKATKEGSHIRRLIALAKIYDSGA